MPVTNDGAKSQDFIQKARLFDSKQTKQAMAEIQEQIDLARAQEEHHLRTKMEQENVHNEYQPTLGESRNCFHKLNVTSQIATDEQEISMLNQLNSTLLADYEFLKEKGDDVRVYLDEKKYIPQKA